MEPYRSKAELDVLAERTKQRETWGNHHDDEHGSGDISRAALCLVTCTPHHWGLLEKPRYAHRRDRLVVAAALLIAEIDRLDREAEHGR